MKSRALPPYPSGWFTVSLARNLRPGAVQRIQFMGQEAVLFRTQSGTPALIDAYCPHLGAHFAYGGTVQGECLRCPFHHFLYNTDGVCVETAYGTKTPPNAKAHTWPVIERNGFVLAYYDAEGNAPTWDIPQLDHEGWTPIQYRTHALNSHPQETSENSVDMGHLIAVHGYKGVEVRRDLRLDGPLLNTVYAMRRPSGPMMVEAEFEVNVHGLGYSQVSVNVRRFNLDYRLWVMSMPVDGARILMHTGVSMKRLPSGAAIHPLLFWLPGALLTPIIARTTYNEFHHDLQQDFEIWENKIYVDPPSLAAGDGPIGRYRYWTKQFYARQGVMSATPSALSAPSAASGD